VTKRAASAKLNLGELLNGRPPGRLWFLELALVLVRLDHVTSFIVNANLKLSEKPKSDLAATAVGCDDRAVSIQFATCSTAR
jgi:hypothetical protein